ncbi:ATPase components of ABC transporters with duplicated ATPase domains [Marininema mesophilum]|uniref:ATPase components of ABC transporters with duplicated ATPase domains n=1 Tax=Marininema mesophilum TaxID=1048340 RepID=A0A1H3C229_9BACL|nr:ABC-F family ATP-binding cassette domain-containing protein [Marininema mesophilum]SDX48156.1 ATPase components of ABC transporters with duplicated ATPase domains [Marininema mesophilum]
MILCATNRVGKLIGTHWVFENITMDIRDGEKIGWVGPNGCGKTTLLRILAGEETPDRGEVFHRKGAKIGYLTQIPHFSREVSVREALLDTFDQTQALQLELNRLSEQMGDPSLSEEKLERILLRFQNTQEAFERSGGYEQEAKVRKVAHGLGFSEEMLESSFHILSGGEKTKVGLARILLQEPDLLLLDEPTNHLDLAAVEWLEEYLSRSTATVIVVSHDRTFLDRAVHRIFDIEGGELVIYEGGYSAFVKEKEKRLLIEFEAYQEQQKKIKKMKEAIKRLREWANRANPPNDGMHRRANSMEKALNRIERLKKPVLERKKIGLTFEMEERSGQDVLILKDVSKWFGDRILLEDVDLQVRFRERLAILGGNGSGKTTLLKMATSQLEPDIGEVRLGSGAKVGYLSQAGWEGGEDLTVLEAFREEVPVEEGEARRLLAKFLFYGYAVFRPVGQISGGERMRLRLAQLMYQEVNFLILDEPTNHLDIDSREALEEALLDFTGTILAVSHDRWFLNRLFAPVFWLEEGSLLRYEGNYDQAREKRQQRLIGNKGENY